MEIYPNQLTEYEHFLSDFYLWLLANKKKMQTCKEVYLWIFCSVVPDFTAFSQ